MFRVNLLSLQCLYPYRKPRWAEVGQIYIWYKAFLYALVLMNWNLANSQTSQEQSNNERLIRCIIYSPLCLRTALPFVGSEGELYSYTGVGLSALYQRCT